MLSPVSVSLSAQKLLKKLSTDFYEFFLKGQYVAQEQFLVTIGIMIWIWKCRMSAKMSAFRSFLVYYV